MRDTTRRLCAIALAAFLLLPATTVAAAPAAAVNEAVGRTLQWLDVLVHLVTGSSPPPVIALDVDGAEAQQDSTDGRDPGGDDHTDGPGGQSVDDEES